MSKQSPRDSIPNHESGRIDFDLMEVLCRGLTGDFEYECQTDSDTEFLTEGDSREIGRGGIMSIDVRLGPIGLEASINAQRLWRRLRKPDGETKKIPLPTAVPWKSTGGFRMTPTEIEFQYTGSNEIKGHGRTTDYFKIHRPMNSTLKEIKPSPGTFDHYTQDNRRVAGIVTLRRMGNDSDFIWAPDGTYYNGVSVGRPQPGSPEGSAEPVYEEPVYS